MIKYFTYQFNNDLILIVYTLIEVKILVVIIWINLIIPMLMW